MGTTRQEEHEVLDIHTRDREAWNLPTPVKRRPGFERTRRLDEGELADQPGDPPELDPTA